MKGTCSPQHGQAAGLAPASRADSSEEERELLDLVRPKIGLGETLKRVSGGEGCSEGIAAAGGREGNAACSGSMAELLLNAAV